MAKITKVPNGPLIKKKGPFKGSTLKTGGVIKKAQVGDTVTVKKPTWQKMTPAQRAAIKAELGPEKFKKYKDSVSTDATNRREDILNRNAAARGMTREQVRAQQEKAKKKPDACLPGLRGTGNDTPGCSGSQRANDKRLEKERNRRNGGPVKKAKAGAMIKRADGSMSRRGLWDNIRANKGSGKKPTKQMLVQEKKIKAKSKK
jgi:hypothetical protein